MSLNVQACASLDTFAEEMVEAAASRVFARSAFEYGHEPEARTLEAATLLVTVRQPALEIAVVLPPQETTKPMARTRAAPIVR